MRPLSRLPRLLPLLCPFLAHGAVINGYAEITAISSTTLTVGSSSEAAAQFTAGKDIILMQMQDDVIGPDTADNATFGTLDNIRMAGVYIVRTIASVARSSGTLTSITLTTVPGVTFNFGVNAAVQAITYEQPGGNGSYTTSAAIDAPAWNGRIGGVVALQVKGTLTVQNDITADGRGFRGGAKDPYTYDVCYPNAYRASSTDANTWRYASKGEGIYRLNTTNWADGRGRILNGAGGGNGINAGGGGGGNFTQGGQGGPGYSCSASPSGGLGGAALDAQISASRVFLGGGGGGGEGNDNVSTDGGVGGGIILLKATMLATAGSTAVVISANGAAAVNAGNDGAGGGGAGGSIVLQVSSFGAIAGAPLTIRANGGSGGSVAYSDVHGGGGGGGQGTVIYSVVKPTTNITTQTNNGTGGCNNNSIPCNSPAGTAAGTSGAGVLQNVGGVLPIELLHFDAVPVGTEVRLEWATASESDNARFVVERSADTEHWSDVLELPGAGNSVAVLHYEGTDDAPLNGQSYYRLRQIDTDGTSTLSAMVPVRIEDNGMRMSVFPNPANEQLDVRMPGTAGGRVEVWSSLGLPVSVQGLVRDGRSTLDLSALPSGSYIVVWIGEGSVLQQRIIVQH